MRSPLLLLIATQTALLVAVAAAPSEAQGPRGRALEGVRFDAVQGAWDVTAELTHWTRTAIQAQADEQVRGRKPTVRALPAKKEPA